MGRQTSCKEKCDERDENLSYSERDRMEILLYCGDCIGEDHKYFLRGHSVLVYLTYQLIDGRLHRYADLTLDKGFKIVLGRIGSERILMNMLNWAQKYFNKRAVYYSSAS